MKQPGLPPGFSEKGFAGKQDTHHKAESRMGRTPIPPLPATRKSVEKFLVALLLHLRRIFGLFQGDFAQSLE